MMMVMMMMMMMMMMIIIIIRLPLYVNYTQRECHNYFFLVQALFVSHVTGTAIQMDGPFQGRQNVTEGQLGLLRIT